MKELNELLNRQHREWLGRIITIKIMLRRGLGPWKV